MLDQTKQNILLLLQICSDLNVSQVECIKKFTYCSGNRVLRHESKCPNVLAGTQSTVTKIELHETENCKVIVTKK